jgi:hypothetical protein|nr:MAG TPA: hypothetical protein [Caudoviricetes sp.]
MNDKQFTDELFKRMYDLGYRKAEIEDDTLFFFVNERDCLCPFSPRVPVKSTCFEEKDQLINIGEYLGIVDWSKVAVDTPILVRNDGVVWIRSYFAGYKSGKVRTYFNGATSWSSDGRVVSWDYAKLAEV